jgi:hypothetical protein
MRSFVISRGWRRWFVDFVDIADLEPEAACRAPEKGVQRVRRPAGWDVQAHGKTAPGELLAALCSVM